MKELNIKKEIDKMLIPIYYVISGIAVFTLIGYTGLFIAGVDVGIQLASVFCMNGLLFCGWMISKYWNKLPNKEHIADRYLWLGASAIALYACLQILDSGLWLFIPAALFLLFFSAYLKDMIKTIVDWKHNTKLVWK